MKFDKKEMQPKTGEIYWGWGNFQVALELQIRMGS